MDYYLSNRPHFLWVYRRDPSASDLQAFRAVLPTSGVGYPDAGRPIESVVHCFYKITLVFYGFTGTINRRFLTNQNARPILVIL